MRHIKNRAVKTFFMVGRLGFEKMVASGKTCDARLDQEKKVKNLTGSSKRPTTEKPGQLPLYAIAAYCDPPEAAIIEAMGHRTLVR
jgi:hypothetical protein